MRTNEIIEYFSKTLNVPAGHIEELLEFTGLISGDLIERKYLDHKGMKCPHCGGKNVEAGWIVEGEDDIWQSIECVDCGKEWVDLFTLTGIDYSEN